MRSKMDYVQEKDANGRQGMEYEFTLVAEMEVDHSLIISKSRCNLMADQVAKKPDVSFWIPLVEWLNSGAATPELTPEERKAKAEAVAANAARRATEASAEKERAEAAAAAEKARSTGYTALCEELVKAGHYPGQTAPA